MARVCVSLLRLWTEFQLHTEIVSSNSAFDSRCKCCRKMSQQSKRPQLLQRECKATSVQLREVLKMSQGYHNLNRTTKQPVVMSPAVQFHPVPLTKRTPVNVGHVNRFIRQ